MNEIVVTRAPRLRSARQSAIRPGTYFLQATSNPMNQYGLFEMGHSGISLVNGPFELPYDIELGDIQVVPFESFDAMCKWVAGGRKLEDLQGIVDYEGTTFQKTKVGTISAIVRDDDFPHSHWCGRHGIRTKDNVTILETGETMKGLNLPFRVWPLGPEDRITITAKP